MTVSKTSITPKIDWKNVKRIRVCDDIYSRFVKDSQMQYQTEDLPLMILNLAETYGAIAGMVLDVVEVDKNLIKIRIPENVNIRELHKKRGVFVHKEYVEQASESSKPELSSLAMPVPTKEDMMDVLKGMGLEHLIKR